MGIQRVVRYHSCDTRQYRRGTLVVSRVMTASMVNGHCESRVGQKSHQGRIHTKALTVRGEENFIQARQVRIVFGGRAA
jgi:hypothetical protein